MPASPQLSITQSINITAAQIRTLFSAPPVIVPPTLNFSSVFAGGTIFYIFDTTAFANFDNLLYFELGDLTPIVVSNQLNATNLLSLSGASYIFTPINPYTPTTDTSSNLPIRLKLANADPTGGGDNAQLIVNFTYHLLQKS